MALTDRCCTIVPYFKVHDGKLEQFKALCLRFIGRTETEPKCLFYGFSFDGDQAHCREGYTDAEGILAHLESVGPLLREVLEISSLTRLEIHGPGDQIALLRGPLAELNPQYFVMEHGFRR